MRPHYRRFAWAAATGVLTAAALSAIGWAAGPPPGQHKSAKTQALEAGAKLLQHNAPVAAMDVHLDGFHPMKLHPAEQMEAHHFCRQVNEDFMQCVLFDGNGHDARLNGVEYIVSEKLFNTLPEQERKYWHPHNGEILSGQLVAPGIPQAAEKALMKSKLNSYGKTWHFWNTGSAGKGGDALPLGEPMLAWSFNRDGEAQPGLVEQRDKRMGVDSAARRRERAELTPLAHPQSGVDDLKGAFPAPVREIPGVIDRNAASAPSR
jgi:hypothetical protein